MYVPEVLVVKCASVLSLNRSSDVPTMYVLPMEKHELDFITSICTLSCNILLHDCTRHTRTLPLLIDLEASREVVLRGLGSFIETDIGTEECALGERA
jgi:hypothetical protein